ncbi:MAG: metallophosphoesterase [Lachnospiraceae bacterium]|nr:metallophosphoesterase [Lachnospiraceae bacterium]
MKVLIVSDTHRSNANYFKVVEMHKPDMVVHCGDVEGSEYALSQAAGCEVVMVSGNNDFFSSLPKEVEFRVGKYKCFATHGHYYRVSMGTEMLYEEARHRGCDIVMYGHTHKPEVRREGSVIIVNPGSLSYPRQEGRKPSYIIMEIDRFEEVHFTIAYV